jgi:hypothetical protein
VFFVSHDTAFDTSSFPYHIYIDSGIVVETNLPTGTSATPDTPMPLDTNSVCTTNSNGTDPSTEKQEAISLETVSNMP